MTFRNPESESDFHFPSPELVNHCTKDVKRKEIHCTKDVKRKDGHVFSSELALVVGFPEAILRVGNKLFSGKTSVEQFSFGRKRETLSSKIGRFL